MFLSTPRPVKEQPPRRRLRPAGIRGYSPNSRSPPITAATHQMGGIWPMTTPKTTARLLAALCAITLAAGTAACGNDNDDADNNAGAGAGAAKSDQADAKQTSPADDTSDAASKQPATDDGQIRALIAQAQQAFKAGDGQTACDGLNAAGQRDILDYGKAMGIKGGCPDIVKSIAKTNKAAGLEQPPTRVVAVRVRGQRATALIRIPGTGPVRQGYQKINGQWKQQPLGLADALAGRPVP